MDMIYDDVKVKSLREQIGMVLQDTILFSDTVKSNILMGNPDGTDPEVMLLESGECT